MLQAFIDWTWRVNDQLTEVGRQIRRLSLKQALIVALLGATLPALVILILVAVSLLKPEPLPVYDVWDSGDAISLRVGEEFVVKLDGSRDFRHWAIVSPQYPTYYYPSEGAVLRLVDVEADCPPTLTIPQNCSEYRYKFRTVGAGQVVLEMELNATGIGRIGHFVLQITVR